LRVLVVANINSTHTKKWLLALKGKGVIIFLFSLHKPIFDDDWYKHLDGYYHPKVSKFFLSDFLIFKYLAAYFKLKKCISSFAPDILHSHYISNYAFIANAMRFKKHITTAWGSDVFVFPKSNFISKQVVRFNLKYASSIVSTSSFMADEIRKYTKKKISVIPFGIDFTLYNENKKIRNLKVINIGCFKKIDYTYGTDTLIHAFNIVQKELFDYDVKLNIIGDGNEMSNIISLVQELKLNEKVNFLGWQNPDSIPHLLENIDICVYLSRRESFGVSLVEAMASKTPLVVSNIPAFREVLGGEPNGLFVEVDDFREAADSIIRLVKNVVLSNSMAENAYNYASKYYNIDKCIGEQIDLYNSVLSDLI
jgi:L-malate glycosyltransferase